QRGAAVQAVRSLKCNHERHQRQPLTTLTKGRPLGFVSFERFVVSWLRDVNRHHTMKIAVCIKQVPTREWQPRLNDDKTWIREQDAAFEMNEPDAYALEESLRLKEKHGGEVVVCSAGPARVAQVIREALARGADRAIHVGGDGLASADGFVVADSLAAVMKEEQCDLVLTGL